MPRSDNARSGRIGLQTLDSVSRYDLVLALIPVVFLLSVVLGHLLSVPFRTTLVGASAVGALVLLDALFVNPPVRPTQ
ncbi:hypothetical protein [Halorientalis pallida]|uniref:Uncharacterized protein n=1 Tax=Halorientalis pallida TaxID=2479928 RepID=A0A498KVA1_9EURY|nr:hypothetical protein [Halorientalis pallida]RXK49198.1 hypothetical protein EAF64_09765 [Halorientalis pallida]